ncbi:hypothetical protein BG418_25195 [Streptomyces sp. CBMA152]|nr:hypothetical protein [Streptomyces sp. CBMA152]
MPRGGVTAGHTLVIPRRHVDNAVVDPITAAQLVALQALPLRSRVRRLAGVAPIPAFSGLTNRHRISRSGDRQLNRALHTITPIQCNGGERGVRAA